MIGRNFEKVVEGALIALVVLTPLPFGSARQWAFRLIEFSAFFLLSLWFLKARKAGGYSYVKTPLVYALPISAVFFIACLLPLPAGLVAVLSPGRQAFREAAGVEGGFDTLALYPWAAGDQAVFLFSVLVIFFLTVNYIRSREQVRRLTYAAVGMGVLLALGAFVQKAASPGTETFLPFINKNHFAGLMELTIPLAASSLAVDALGAFRLEGMKERLLRSFRGPGAAWAVARSFFVLLMVAALLLTLSRGGALGLVFSFIVMGGLLARDKKKAAVLTVAAAIVLSVGLGMADKDLVAKRMGTLAGVGKDGSAMFRLNVWKDTLGMVSDFPVTGVGPGGFETAYPLYKTFKRERNVFQPEDDYLYILAEGGVIGLVIAAAFYFILLRTVVSRLKKRKDPFVLSVGVGGVSGLAALTLHGLVDTNFHMPSNLVLAAVIAALSFAVVHGRFDQRSHGKGLQERKKVLIRTGAARAGMALGAALCLTVCIVSLAGAAGDMMYRLALREKMEITGPSPVRKPGLDDYTGLIKKLGIASRLDPGSAAYAFEEGMAYAALAEYSLRMESDGRVEPGPLPSFEYYETACNSFKESLRRNPYSSFAHLMAGRMMEYGLGEAEAGEAHYKNAERLNPTSPFIKQYLSSYYGKAGDAGLARKYELLAAEMDPAYNKLAVTSLSPDTSGNEALIGEDVLWTAAASALRGELEYKFRLWDGERWEDMTPYSKSPAWSWKTKGEKAGAYRVMVLVRGVDGAAPVKVFSRKEPYYLREQGQGM